MDPQGGAHGKSAIAVDSDVLIVGGGIGGLSTALALAGQGFSSKILERQGSFSNDGAGIQIGPNGTAVLTKLNVLERLRPMASRPEGIFVCEGRSGRELVRLPLGDDIERRHGAPYLVAHRADLHRALADAVRADEKITLQIPIEISGLQEDNGLVVVRDNKDRSWQSPAVVFADGLWSFARRQHVDRSPLRVVGKSAARAIIPVKDIPDGIRSDIVGVWLHHRAHVVHYPIRNGREIAVVVVVDDHAAVEDWGIDAVKSDVQRAVRDFAKPVQHLIQSVTQWRKWGLNELPLVQKMVRGRVALVGDAAHPILPFLAQGGVMAMEDGLALASCLAQDRHDVRTAFRTYEEKRLSRVRRVQAASKRNGQVYHLSGPLAVARDVMLRTMSPRRLMAQYDWLYGYPV